MTKPLVSLGLTLVLAVAPELRAAHSHASEGGRAPELMSGLGDAHHQVSTKSRDAQRYFDQGLKLVYGFNHDEARRAFEYAAKLDPKLAMAWWGVALTLGTNYNLPIDPEREKAGYDAIQKALSLQGNASDPEKAYIAALAHRYSSDPSADMYKLDLAYKEAMAKVTAAYPDDLDAATLYAESAMNLHPWKLWLPDGRPNEGTEEIVSVLESVLRRDPNHLGANHYYIHAVEASPHPERALPSASRLEKMAPAAGHLTHMPAHIYARVGEHAKAAHCNEEAAQADKQYIAETKVKGVYPLMYYSHNLHFLAFSACMRGNLPEAKDAAKRLVANVSPAVKEMPMLEGFMPTPILVLLAFERWSDILDVPEPDGSLKITTAIWHFARGMAQANLGKTELASEEQLLGKAIVDQIPPDTAYDDQNKTGDVFKIHEALLQAMITRSRHDDKESLDAINRAIAAEDALNYSEPPAWYPPVRPTLGRWLLTAKKFAEAEQVFRLDLQKNPRHGRSLAGLRDCLNEAGHPYEAEQIDQQYREAWNVEPDRDRKSRDRDR